MGHITAWEEDYKGSNTSPSLQSPLANSWSPSCSSSLGIHMARSWCWNDKDFSCTLQVRSVSGHCRELRFKRSYTRRYILGCIHHNMGFMTQVETYVGCGDTCCSIPSLMGEQIQVSCNWGMFRHLDRCCATNVRSSRFIEWVTVVFESFFLILTACILDCGM
jgi:hypothetical protein